MEKINKDTTKKKVSTSGQILDNEWAASSHVIFNATNKLLIREMCGFFNSWKLMVAKQHTHTHTHSI